MSDTDWMWEAADRLDDGGIHGQREWPEDDLCICGLDWSAQHRRDIATAPLLRLHARLLEGVKGTIVAAAIVAAQELADTILETSDE